MSRYGIGWILIGLTVTVGPAISYIQKIPVNVAGPAHVAAIVVIGFFMTSGKQERAT